MNTFRRIGRLINTLILVICFGSIKVACLAATLLALLSEGLGMLFYPSTIQKWLVRNVGVKLATFVLTLEEIELYLLKSHVIANRTFVNKIDVKDFEGLSETMNVEQWPAGKPMPKIDPSEVN